MKTASATPTIFQSEPAREIRRWRALWTGVPPGRFGHSFIASENCNNAFGGQVRLSAMLIGRGRLYLLILHRSVSRLIPRSPAARL